MKDEALEWVAFKGTNRTIRDRRRGHSNITDSRDSNRPAISRADMRPSISSQVRNHSHSRRRLALHLRSTRKPVSVWLCKTAYLFNKNGQLCFFPALLFVSIYCTLLLDQHWVSVVPESRIPIFVKIKAGVSISELWKGHRAARSWRNKYRFYAGIV